MIALFLAFLGCICLGGGILLSEELVVGMGIGFIISALLTGGFGR